MNKVKMPNGKEYNFAPAGFTVEVVRLVEIFEEIGGGAKPSYGELLRNLRSVLVDCLKRGGHKPADADEAISSLPIGDDLSDYLPKIRKAIGLD